MEKKEKNVRKIYKGQIQVVQKKESNTRIIPTINPASNNLNFKSQASQSKTRFFNKKQSVNCKASKDGPGMGTLIQ